MDLLKSLKERRQLRQDYDATFSTPHGKRVLSHLFREAGVTIPRMHTDTESMLLDKGMQRIVWSIHRMLHAKPDLDKEIESIEKPESTT